jgi:CheY-like chemotaxis protein
MEQQAKKILWIDDDINRYSLMPYIDEFNENGFEIVKAANPDESDIILSTQHDFQCIIVDVSMPLGENIKFGEAKGGMQTGLVYLQKLVDNANLNNVKKVVFTIVDNSEMREYCKSQTPEILYLEKHRYFTDTFVQKIKNILSQNNEE